MATLSFPVNLCSKYLKMSSLVFFAFFVFTLIICRGDAEADIPSQFEAAFQGRCGHDSPCQQLCYELHDGMFECDCSGGFVLHDDGYTCLLVNDSSNETITRNNSTTVDDEIDIIYQKDASFSASLDTYPKGNVQKWTKVSQAIQFITEPSESRRDWLPTEDTLLVATTQSRTTQFLSNSSFFLIQTNVNAKLDVDITAAQNITANLTIQNGLHTESDVEIRVPKFGGQSWLAFPALRAAYKHVQLQVEFRPKTWDGILFLTGERDDLAGDFVAVILHEGFVEFRFDCGSGVGIVRSDETVSLNKWNKLTVYRHRWDAWIQLNKGKRVRGRSKGLFSRITFREPVFIGGRGNTTVLSDKIPTDKGFRGCVRYLEINGVLYNFAISPFGDAISGSDVEECVADRCSNVACKHGGKCENNDESTRCLCPLGFVGDLCETRLDLQIPQFNGTSFLKYHGLGYSSLSWLDIEMVVKPTLADGILLYNGHKMDGMGDFVAIYMSDGHLFFTFDLGTGSAALRSTYPITLEEWHRVKISRTGRYAILQVDSQPPTQMMSPGAYTQLSLMLDMYVGGVPYFDLISPKIKIRQSFVGCVQKIVINDRPMHILAEAVAGLNIDNCPHACLAQPCSKMNELSCEPLFDSYKCVCEHNCSQVISNELAIVTNIATFKGGSFLQYIDPEVIKRITGENVSLNLRFKTTSLTGVLLWYGSTQYHNHFLSLTIINGYLHLSCHVGRSQINLFYNKTKLNDGHWHRVNIIRELYASSLTVDNEDIVVGQSKARLGHLRANSGLYVGGIENNVWATNNSKNKKSSSIKGCFSDFVLNSEYHLKLSWKRNDSSYCE